MLVEQYLFEGIFASLLGFVLLYGLRGKKKGAGVAGSALAYTLAKGAANIIFPIIKVEGVRQMFFPATVPAHYRALLAP